MILRAKKEGKWRLESIKDSIHFCTNEYDAANEADAMVILTDWAQFKTMDPDKIFETMKGNYLF